MNFPKSIVTLVFASLLFVGCKEKTNTKDLSAKVVTETPKVKKEIASSNLQTASFAIKGMVCEFGCAKTIEAELNKTEGVQKAAVDFKKESATISYDKTVMNPESITKLVEATGDGKTYKVADFK
ncbi:heavy-metal-associated domain-containing protein [Flavobacterium cellulosilyticum]|uniref:Heavy-metal-associated domain-containing protein n=1 Tax=Flavobacterium cellulosilyticum TaxID=2541731 RepID=A0A4V2YZD4_9FLAO|nr:heavy metal-associated domain-containing protein [Flavobacterium cellulosilyticum]TDD96587.1 heavy-metal-associated domain-containing protein [Flavobacterium cellulosilyticum]